MSSVFCAQIIWMRLLLQWECGRIHFEVVSQPSLQSEDEMMTCSVVTEKLFICS